MQIQVAAVRRRYTSPSRRLLADLMGCAAIAFTLKLALTLCLAATALALVIAAHGTG